MSSGEKAKVAQRSEVYETTSIAHPWSCVIAGNSAVGLEIWRLAVTTSNDHLSVVVRLLLLAAIGIACNRDAIRGMLQR